MKNTKLTVTNTLGLMTFNDWAIENNMNRSVCEDIIKKVDIDGKHVCIGKIEHHHSLGVKVVKHYRTMWLVKLKNKAEPILVFIDVNPVIFKAGIYYVTVDEQNYLQSDLYERE